MNRIGAMTGRHLESSRVIRFILDVEDVVLDLLRGDRRRLIILTTLPVVCYGIMAFEVWLVLWAVGEPVGITAALAIETFARLGSVASAFIPANIGALEASNAAPVAMLGLGGGGALALSRRVRATLWAVLGLVLYPRIKSQRPNSIARLTQDEIRALNATTTDFALLFANVPRSRRSSGVELSTFLYSTIRSADRHSSCETPGRAPLPQNESMSATRLSHRFARESA